MAKIQLKDNVYYVGASDPERRLFDELIPLPDGTTYNSELNFYSLLIIVQTIR